MSLSCPIQDVTLIPSLHPSLPTLNSGSPACQASQPSKTQGVTSAFKVKVLVAQSRPTLCDPMDCSPPGSSAHGILQAKILGWVSHSLLQRIFQTQRWNAGHPHYRWLLCHLSHEGSPHWRGLALQKSFSREVECLSFLFPNQRPGKEGSA